MFGSDKKKRQRLAELERTIARCEPVLESTDPAELGRAHDAVLDAWREADDGPLRERAWDLARSLQSRREELGRKRLQATLRCCPHCEGREYRVSEELAIEKLDLPSRWKTSPKMRMVVCVGCGAASFFLANVAEVTTGAWADHFGLALRVPDAGGGPFR